MRRASGGLSPATNDWRRAALDGWLRWIPAQEPDAERNCDGSCSSENRRQPVASLVNLRPSPQYSYWDNQCEGYYDPQP